MYRIDGRHDLPEQVLKNFEGYKKSRPVRIGNAASKQLQMDIYGELLDSVYIYDKHGEPISYDFWMNLTTLVEWVCKNWKKPDNGHLGSARRSAANFSIRAPCAGWPSTAP